MPGIAARSVTRRRARHVLLLPGIALALALALAAATALAQHDAEPAAIARATVAAALGIDPAAVRVISVEARDFPDGSLGCPQPGAAYAQVITPGHQVLAEADGRRFDVRVAGGAGRICRLRKPAGTTGGPRPRESGEAARADLAARLGVPVESVAIDALRRLAPGEALDGCGTPCAAGGAAATCPVAVRLRAGDRTVEYVARPDGVRPCPELAAR